MSAVFEVGALAGVCACGLLGRVWTVLSAACVACWVVERHQSRACVRANGPDTLCVLTDVACLPHRAVLCCAGAEKISTVQEAADLIAAQIASK